MAEQIDVYDANLQHIGAMERVAAHKQGMWHRTFHCWVATNRDGGKLLFQLRSPQMVNFPNMFDVSAAGHLEAGETVDEGIREVSEELGIPINPEELFSLGYRVEVADQSNGQLNREYQAVYLLRVDRPLEEYSPQVEEVTGLMWLSIVDGLRLFSDQLERCTMKGMVYENSEDKWLVAQREVSKSDFLPRIQNYYLTACIMAERLLEERFPLAIS